MRASMTARPLDGLAEVAAWERDQLAPLNSLDPAPVRNSEGSLQLGESVPVSVSWWQMSPLTTSAPVGLVARESPSRQDLRGNTYVTSNV